VNDRLVREFGKDAWKPNFDGVLSVQTEGQNMPRPAKTWMEYGEYNFPGRKFVWPDGSLLAIRRNIISLSSGWNTGQSKMDHRSGGSWFIAWLTLRLLPE
jgi:hypothetical protein